MLRNFLFASLFLAACSTIGNASVILVNFETVPVEATGPSVFTAGQAPQTITVPSVATFTGGVILGNETNLPAQSFGTPPNVYATAGFDSLLSSTLTIAIAPLFPVTEVSFPLFNGSTQTESYVVTVFNGATNVASETLSMASNLSSGFGIFDLKASNITSVTIMPTALDAGCCSGWDYSIDSVALNQSVQQAFAPEPGTFVLLGLGLAGFGLRRLRR